MKTLKNLVLLCIIVFLLFACAEKEEPTENEPRSYTKSIERTFTGEFEQSLIDKAEKYYPPREEVIAGIPQIVLEIPQSKYWFYNSIDNVKIPYCITIDAINYYSDYIDELNKDKQANFLIAAEFEYKAKVELKESYVSPATDSNGKAVIPDEYTLVYVVTLELSWSDYCGNLCALWIDKERIVVFNQAGELLNVYKDGIVPIAVS